MFENAPSNEAVFFFNDQGDVCKEMLYTEFEAVLDGVVGMDDFANQNRKAAFIVINSQLLATAVVYFVIQFDKNGMAPRNWNIPLRHLADTAGTGPDMGAGPIRLACRSQCSVSWHTSSMWDPDMSPQNNTFVKIRNAVTNNRLCLSQSSSPAPSFQAPPDGGFGGNPYAAPLPDQGAGFQGGGYGQQPPMQQQPMNQNIPTLQPNSSQGWNGQYPQQNYQQPPAQQPPMQQQPSPQMLQQQAEKDAEQRNKVAKLIKAQRLHIQTLTNKHEEEIAKVKYTAQQERQQLTTDLAQVRSQMESLHGQNLALREQCEAQRSQLDSMKSALDVKTKEAAEHERVELDTIKQQYENLMEQRLKEETGKLKEELQLRDMELMYRHEVAKQLREELTVLRKDKIRLVNAGADKFLEKLEELGISFIAFHPGAGHISIPLQDMSRYMEDPIAYAADRCLVSEDHYRSWLAHYENPSCQSEYAEDKICNVKISRVDVPSQFQLGVHDRCMKHKPNQGDSEKVVNLVK